MARYQGFSPDAGLGVQFGVKLAFVPAGTGDAQETLLVQVETGAHLDITTRGRGLPDDSDSFLLGGGVTLETVLTEEGVALFADARITSYNVCYTKLLRWRRGRRSGRRRRPGS